MDRSLAAFLRGRHRYTWLIFSGLFLLWAYNWPNAGSDFKIKPLLLLVVLYFSISQGVATLIARIAARPVSDPVTDFFKATYKGGIIASGIIFLLNMGFFWLGSRYEWSWLPDFRSVAAVLVGSLVFPFLACLSAAVNVGRR